MRKTAARFRRVSRRSFGARPVVFLTIRGLLQALPNATVKLKQADGALNFVYTNLTRATAFDYQNAATATTGYGPSANQAAAGATTQQITAAGVALSETFLARIRANGEGVILVEARQLSGAPLRLVVENAGVQIPEVELPLLGARFEPRPGMVQKGWDAYLEKGTPWTSVVAGEQGQVVRFHVATNAAAASIGFEVAPAGRAYLQNVDAQGRLLTSPGGAVFTLSGTYTDIPIYAAPQTGADTWIAEIIAKKTSPDGQLATEIDRLKICILVRRELRIHLYKVVDENSSETAFSQMPAMPELLTTLNGIFSQSGIRFIAGNEQTLGGNQLGINYDDLIPNGKLDHPFPDPNPLTRQESEWERLQRYLRLYIQDPNNHSPEQIRADYFAFVYKESGRPTGIALNNNQVYHQRGGNVTGPNQLGSRGREYGPFVASVGSTGTEELAAVIAHETGHTLNLNFLFPALLTELINEGVRPPLFDEEPNSTSGHDNFNYMNPDFPSETDAQIWSLMRAGVFRGDVKFINQWSRSLRKIFWVETNLRAARRLSPATNP